MYRQAAFLFAIALGVLQAPPAAGASATDATKAGWVVSQRGEPGSGERRCTVFPQDRSYPYPLFIFSAGHDPWIAVSFSEVGNTRIAVQVDAHPELSHAKAILDRDAATALAQVRAGGRQLTASDSFARNTFSTDGLLPLLEECAASMDP